MRVREKKVAYKRSGSAIKQNAGPDPPYVNADPKPWWPRVERDVVSPGAALALYCTLHYEKPLAACIALSTFFPETRLPDPSLLHNKGEASFSTLKGQCHEMDIFGKFKPFNQHLPSVYALMVFNDFKKLFTSLYNY